MVRRGRKWRDNIVLYNEIGRRRYRKVTLLPDECASRAALERLQYALDRARCGVYVPIEEVPDFLRPIFLEEVRSAGVKLYLEIEEAGRPIEQHVQHWLNSLEYANRSLKHRRRLDAQMRCMIKYNGWRLIRDVTGEGVEKMLSAWADAGMHARTCNAYRQTISSLCRWLCGNGRLHNNPIVRTPIRDEASDPAYQRMMLSAEEVDRVIAVTRRQNIPRNGTTGADRAIAYEMAAYTGLRGGELLQLRREHVDLENGCIVLEADKTKNRRADLQPINDVLRRHLAEYFEQRRVRPGEKAFRILVKNRVPALREDCRMARVATSDDLGRIVDFHSLRGTFATMLAAEGVHVYDAKRLMRHAKMETTMKYYVQPRLNDLAAAANRIAPRENNEEIADVG